MTMSGAALIGAEVLINRYTGAVHRQPMLGGAGVVTTSLVGPLNVLLVGVDERTAQDDPEGTRADSIIVMHINAAHDSAYLLSIPRDTLADIPAFSKTGYQAGRDKINAAFRYGSGAGAGRAGGFELLAATVRDLTGISFNAGAIINFAGFRSVVDALGGVDLCVDQKVTSIHLNTHGGDLRLGGAAQVYLPGCQHLVPWQALDFARQRYGLPDGDYDRQRHQQQLLKAIAKQAISRGVSNPAGLDRMLTAGGRALTVDLMQTSITDWLCLLPGIGSGGMVMLRTNAGAFASVTCPDGADCEQLTAESVRMFEAARGDTMADFVAAHPSWVATDAA